MKAKFNFILAMLIFGSISIFVKNIHLSSSEIALFRGVIGSVFLIAASFFVKQRLSLKWIKKNIILLILSGAAIGFNWIFLFESYRYTTISIATLSYYFAPVFVLFLAPFILKERLTFGKILSIIIAMIGLFLVIGSGNLNGHYQHGLGIMYGLFAAALYASVILMNKFIKDLSDFDTTVTQLIIAALVLFPYVLLKDSFHFSEMNTKSIIFILLLGILHTGIAYFLYFGAIKQLKGQTIAIFSYIDPISAVIFAFIFLQERMTISQMIGGILILGATFISEKLETKRKNWKKDKLEKHRHTI